MPKRRSPTPAAPARDGSDGAYRPYLDGLRALAVGGVVLYHLNRSWLPGGFLGVDLFFVLSGYLITSILLAEHGREGRIDLARFWSRRVRRLLPALLLVLVAISADVWLRGDPVSASAVRGDLLATLGYVANWHFIFSDQSYFAQYVEPSPVRHAWSLAIEEQFYLAWPLIVGLVLGRWGRRGLAAGTVAVALASVAALWFLFATSADPSRAYFGTDARIHELLIGAGPAMVLQSRWRDAVLVVARPLGGLAALLILTAMFGLADDAAFYYIGGGPLVALAAAVLIAALEAGSWTATALSLRPMVAIGLVSYGVYLWHFPVTLAVQRSMGATGELLAAATVVAVTGALAALSFVLVERPIRRGGSIGALTLTPRKLLVVVPTASSLVLAGIIAATLGAAPPAWSVAARPVVSGPTPSPEAQVAGVSHRRTVAVLGDSVMVSALPGLAAEAAARGWELVPAAVSGCPIGYDALFDDDGRPSPYNERCAEVAAAHAGVVASHPDLVVWHDLQSVLARRSASGDLLHAGSADWTDDLVDEWLGVLTRLSDDGAQVVILVPPHRSQDAIGCEGSVRPERCAQIQQQDELIRTATQALRAEATGLAGVHFLDLDPLLCPTALPCPASIDGTAVRRGDWDQTHFTDAGAAWLAPRLFELVDAALRTAG